MRARRRAYTNLADQTPLKHRDVTIMPSDPDATEIVVSQARLNRGGTWRRGGFYAAHLTPEEAQAAEEMERGLRAEFDLENPADLLLLRPLCTMAVIMGRPLPAGDSERAQNVYNARVRLVADLLDKLAISRRSRVGDVAAADRQAQALLALQAILKRRDPPAG